MYIYSYIYIYINISLEIHTVTSHLWEKETTIMPEIKRVGDNMTMSTVVKYHRNHVYVQTN